MLPRILRSRALPRSSLLLRRNVFVQRRTLIAAPKEGDGPLMQRRPDRELPDVTSGSKTRLLSIPLFLAVLAASALAIFNYQKSSSPVIASTLYALRTSPKARNRLGDEIYFAQKIPWIWGEMNQLHGRIDIEFQVKGTKNSGTMRFKSFRATRQGVFETTEWSLEVDGVKEDLLEGGDPFKTLEMDEDEVKSVGRGLYAPPKIEN